VKRYQMRLSFLMCMVVLAAVLLAGLPYLDWALRGFPYQRTYVQVEDNGITYAIDSRVWPDHHLNPRNRK
jgi:hypothetical protein